MNCTLEEACPACDDSALSYVGNITGILTFALGLAASFVAFFSIIGGIEAKILDMQKRVNTAADQVSGLKSSIKGLVLPGETYPSLEKELSDELSQKLLTILTAFLDNRDKMLKYLEGFELPALPWTRFQWWYKDSETTERFAKFRRSQEECNQQIKDAITVHSLKVLLKRSEQHAHIMHRQLEHLMHINADMGLSQQNLVQNQHQEILSMNEDILRAMAMNNSMLADQQREFHRGANRDHAQNN
ncbi:hypothetical protein QBC44DRAFT_405985 [Cladorrhinum sp. PSN332]|nr:hypothetical protein QBC44DRAFT_405985 [Cladorrhinum sp. PSN332]